MTAQRDALRIPITMCHGTNRGPYFSPAPRWRERPVLDARHFDALMRVAADLGFRSISYDDLEAWRDGATLPDRPILLDFDHPNISIYYEIWPVLKRYGFRGNLFLNTAAMEKTGDRRYMTWDQVREIRDGGWSIGAHMHHHVSLAYLARRDPTGDLIRDEMDTSDAIIERELGTPPRDFAYTTTTWSALAEAEVKRRYRFARLWIVGAMIETETGTQRFADLAGIDGEDEPDGGSPLRARYVTANTDPHRLPSMDFEYLVHDLGAFRRYLEGALDPAIVPEPR